MEVLNPPQFVLKIYKLICVGLNLIRDGTVDCRLHNHVT